MLDNEPILDYDVIVREALCNNAGRQLLDRLKQTYVEVTCLASTSEHTHYQLGMKELVQSLINDVQRIDNEGIRTLSDIQPTYNEETINE